MDQIRRQTTLSSLEANSTLGENGILQLPRLKSFVMGGYDDKGIDYFSRFFDAGAINFGKDVTTPTSEVASVIRKGFEEAAKAYSRNRGATDPSP